VDLAQGAGREACVVVNARAGRGRAVELGKLVERHLCEHGWRVALHVTAAAGDERRFAEQSTDARLFVAIGGDGTLRHVADGLGERGPEVALGIVPVGNANVVARELGVLGHDDRGAIRLLTSGELRVFSVGEVRADERAPELFVAMVGTGLDARTVHTLDRARGTRLGGWLYAHGLSDVLYLACGLPALLRVFPNRVGVTVDGQRLPRRYPTTWVCNTRTYAKGWSVTPAARPDDAELDHHLCRRTFFPLVLWQMTCALRGGAAPGFVSDLGRGVRYALESERPFLWQLDGDPRPAARRLEITVRPGALRLIASASSG
jgi:diacylglycerol kinase family enzyme